MYVPSVGEILDLIDRAIALYDKIQAPPDQIKTMRRQMGGLRSNLQSLQHLLSNKRGMAGLQPSQTRDIEEVMEEIRAKIVEVDEIFHKWENRSNGPFGFQFRFQKVPQALFALGSSPKKLEELGHELDRLKNEVGDRERRLQSFALNAIIAQNQQRQLRKPAAQARPPAALRPAPVNVPAKPAVQAPALPVPAVQVPDVKAPAVQTPAVPLPIRHLQANKMDLSVIFVDSINESRSIVAQAYTQVVRSWTVRHDPSAWRISHIHSAGIFIKAQSDIINWPDSIDPQKMRPGATLPNQIAIAALFENRLLNSAYKDRIRDNVSQQHSRGLSKDMFSTYDYIFVFLESEVQLLEKLREHLNAKGSRARIVLLGKYTASQFGNNEIREPNKANQGNAIQYRGVWNERVSRIRFALKGFLKQELGWVQPPTNDPHQK